MGAALDLTGHRYGNVVVVERVGSVEQLTRGPRRSIHALWRCKCDCGNACDFSAARLRDPTGGAPMCPACKLQRHAAKLARRQRLLT
jgi:hypothetical protein